jgi:tRNA modification GTPase
MSTIAAISTATGIGGIGIIRISGERCFEILSKIFIPKNPEKIEKIKGYTMKYGKIINPKTKQEIDEVLVSYFKAPKSYTTEDMCEINSHG